MMKKNLGALPLCMILCIWVMIFQACDDPTDVGTGIVNGSDLPILVEELTVEFSQRRGTPITTYVAPGLSQLNHAQCGILQDDVFGRTEASFSMQFHTLTKQISFDPTRVIDSVRLYLYLDSVSTYGVVQAMPIKVVRLAEKIDGGQSYDADQTFSLGADLTTVSVTPDFSSLGDDAIENGPFISIPLSNNIGKELFLLDSAILARDSAFIEHFKGVHIQSGGVSDCLLGFKPLRTNDQSVLTSLRIYYRNDTTLQDTSLVMILSPTSGYFISPVIQQYAFDYAGSAVEKHLNAPTDSILFIQGQGGVNVNMRVPNITDLGGAVINKAELFIPFDKDVLEYSKFKELRTLFLTQESLGGSQQFIPEFNETSTFNFSPIGRLDTINSAIGYIYNIPVHAQNLIDGTIFDMDIRLQSVSVSNDQNRRESFGPLNLKEASARSVIFGRNNRLKISYTKIN